MKAFKLAAALALSATLAACGGGGGGSSTGSAPAATAPVLKQCAAIRIQLFGDSTQWGLDGATKVRAAVYPELALQQAMNNRFGIGKIIVSTRAVEATTSQMLVDGTDRLNKPWPQSVDADIVVMNHGTNDDLLNTGVEQYKTNLRALAKAPAIVVFETHLPVFHRENGYANAMREVAAQLGVPLIDSKRYAESLPNWEQHQPDYVHPTSDGYSLIARNAKFPVLEPIVAKLRTGCE